MSTSNENATQINYYGLLGVAQNASTLDIRRSYRTALLKVHPDKHTQQQSREERSPALMISQLQDAFQTLTDPNRRATYDQLLKEGMGIATMTPVIQRPAHEVSLDEFDSEEAIEEDGNITSRWSYPCRCGGLFIIKERELEEVWVGYEAVDDVQDQEHKSSPP
ncbi:hypothetical protein FRC12_010049 [Ceratobasidium sp. 428]|nr:hypothetical protein FRC12_010049 [Ceratobasidium sp. 428]